MSRKEAEDEAKPGAKRIRSEDVIPGEAEASMTLALLIYWVLPVLLFAIFSRNFVDTSIPTVETKPLEPVVAKKQAKRQQVIDDQRPSPAPYRPPVASSNWPTSYRETVQEVQQRRPMWVNRPEAASGSPKATAPSASPGSKSKTARTSTDPQRNAAVAQIDEKRDKMTSTPSDIYATIELADALRLFDLNFREGGTYEQEAIETYGRAIEMAKAKRAELVQKGEPTDQSSTAEIRSVSEEVAIGYRSKSADGMLCALRCALGNVLYMANMFEKADEEYTKCLEIVPFYLNALNGRGSVLIILGKLELAAADYLEVIIRDEQRIFNDAFTGLARILEAKESAIEGGWTVVTDLLDRLIPLFEENQMVSTGNAKHYGATSLSRFHHTLFSYHDRKTKDYAEAWRNLQKGYEYKMSTLAPWKTGSEQGKTVNTRRIFVPGFWMQGAGSPTQTPIFIVGFVRSGSTLLERVLDSHPLIVGTGENSVFNGRLDDIRNQLVAASQTGQDYAIPNLTRKLADDVVDGYRDRWEALEANSPSGSNVKNPKRFVDKMLTNYFNIGFIHLLYPQALILHVHRNPMDSVFSAYKHEFPSGTLDYTSDFDALAEIYHAYRDLIDHWDEVLPGRVTHVRYEDMVHDMPGMARAIIDSVGVPWDDEVLDFHKKKHAVNTLSTTQVRKGVYKDSLKSWTKYEDQLQPMVKKLGDRIEFKNLRTLQPMDANDEL